MLQKCDVMRIEINAKNIYSYSLKYYRTKQNVLGKKMDKVLVFQKKCFWLYLELGTIEMYTKNRNKNYLHIDCLKKKGFWFVIMWWPIYFLSISPSSSSSLTLHIILVFTKDFH